METKAYHMTEEEREKLQKVELEMLVEVDRICRKHSIEYFLDGGTLLGAVRHQGFIPWDDDIDTIMLREEYIKFKKACLEELDQERFFLQDYETDPYYRWGYAKLRRNNTEFVRLGQEKSKQHQGVFIDIFVVDNVPDQLLFRKPHLWACYLIRKGLYSEIGKYAEGHQGKRALYKLLSIIPRGMLFKFRNKIANKCNKHRTELISHYTLEYPKRCLYGLPRSCFDEKIELDFEGHKFYAFKNYDLYLSMYYGDYMKLPPEQEQVSHLKISKLKLIEPEL